MYNSKGSRPNINLSNRLSQMKNEEINTSLEQSMGNENINKDVRLLEILEKTRVIFFFILFMNQLEINEHQHRLDLKIKKTNWFRSIKSR